MIKQSLNVKLGQSLTMTPQLQQAIRLLQLSSLELEQEIQTALEENPLLENNELSTTASELSTSRQESDYDDLEKPPSTDDVIPETLPIDTQWDDIYDGNYSSDNGSGAEESMSDYIETRNAEKNDGIREHLLWQINLSPLSVEDRMIAETIVNNINDDGYLAESLDNIHTSLAEDLLIEVDDIKIVLKYIQHLDPVGAGARNLAECLSLQLQQLPLETPQLNAAKQLLEKNLDILEKRDYTRLKRTLKLNQGQMEALIRLLQTLDPKPGSRFSSATAEYIVPDVFVRKIHGQWQVTLNGDNSPKLQINQFYAQMLNRTDLNGDSSYFKQNLQQAKWLINSLKNRNHTILQVAQMIVKHQQAFLTHGATTMKPMIMRDIADELDMHESTISRATTRKYIHTPHGIYELKHFFSSHVGTAAGGTCSSTAIRALIKQLINEENTQKPLSDSKLMTLLKAQGINVARRTVAKYREAMAIPSSRERKCLG